VLARKPYFSEQGHVFEGIFDGVTAEVVAFVCGSLEVAFSRQGAQSVADSLGGEVERVGEIIRILCGSLEELVAHWGNTRWVGRSY